MQMESTITYSELIHCLKKKFARKNMGAVSNGILVFMSALSNIHILVMKTVYVVGSAMNNLTSGVLDRRKTIARRDIWTPFRHNSYKSYISQNMFHLFSVHKRTQKLIAEYFMCLLSVCTDCYIWQTIKAYNLICCNISVGCGSYFSGNKLLNVLYNNL